MHNVPKQKHFEGSSGETRPPKNEKGHDVVDHAKNGHDEQKWTFHKESEYILLLLLKSIPDHRRIRWIPAAHRQSFVEGLFEQRRQGVRAVEGIIGGCIDDGRITRSLLRFHITFLSSSSFASDGCRRWWENEDLTHSCTVSSAQARCVENEERLFISSISLSLWILLTFFKEGEKEKEVEIFLSFLNWASNFVLSCWSWNHR